VLKGTKDHLGVNKQRFEQALWNTALEGGGGGGSE